MKLRQCSYCDYGMTKPEAKELLEICRNADSDMEQNIFEAAQESNEMIANGISFSLRNGVSYDRLFPVDLCGYSKVDFTHTEERRCFC